MRYPQISMSFSLTCLMYDISRINTSVSIVRLAIILQPLLIKFSGCLTRCWSASSASQEQTKTCVFNSEQEDGELVIHCDVFLYVAIVISWPWKSLNSFRGKYMPSLFLFWLVLRKLSAILYGISVESPSNNDCKLSPLPDLVPS